MTARRPWYKRFPSDFRAATAGLPYGVKGTYSHVLDLIYDHGGPIDDKTADIARALGCDPHTWKTHRAVLIKAGKLFVDLGTLMNSRAARELGKIPASTSEHTGKIPETNVSGTKPQKPKRGKALNGTTAHPEKLHIFQSPDSNPLAPFGKGGGGSHGNYGSTKKQRRKSGHDSIVEALRDRQRERDERRGGGQSGGGDPE